MGREDHEHHSETEIVGSKIANINVPESGTGQDEQHVEITLDVKDDSAVVDSVKPANGGEKDTELTLPAEDLEKNSASNVMKDASAKIRQVSHVIMRSASFSRKPQLRRLDRTGTLAAHALKGLKFVGKADGGAEWDAVAKRFIEITASTNGLLPRDRFCECIGMKESKEFAGELFDALARKRNMQGDSISKEELREFWEQISNQSFDSKLQTFFDMSLLFPFCFIKFLRDNYDFQMNKRYFILDSQKKWHGILVGDDEHLLPASPLANYLYRQTFTSRQGDH